LGAKNEGKLHVKITFADPRNDYLLNYDCLCREVRNALPDDAKILTRPKVGLIAWRIGDERFYFYFGPYNEITYRLIIRSAERSELPTWFWMIKIGPHPQDKVFSDAYPQHGSELSFYFTELPSIKGSDLVRFAQDCFRCAEEEDIYLWPLFFEHRRADTGERWEPHYAWTVLGKTKQTEREHEHGYHSEPHASCPLCSVGVVVNFDCP
jgi:hypothetical protein